MRIVVSPPVTSHSFYSEKGSDAQQLPRCPCQSSVISCRYEAELLHPMRSILSGELARALLIQVRCRSQGSLPSACRATVLLRTALNGECTQHGRATASSCARHYMTQWIVAPPLTLRARVYAVLRADPEAEAGRPGGHAGAGPGAAQQRDQLRRHGRHARVAARRRRPLRAQTSHAAQGTKPCDARVW